MNRSVLLPAPRRVECCVDHARELHTQSRTPVVPNPHAAVEALEGHGVQVVHPICCGIDLHQAQLAACLRRATDDRQVTQGVREFATAYPPLLAWLDQRCWPMG
jgi:hypothetical protein